MSRFRQYYGEVPENFGVSVVEGTSMTIPGQGSDLAQIIASIVKLPTLDERTFDVGSGQDPDIRSLTVQTDLNGLYEAEGRNLAEDAKVRQKQRKAAKEAEEKEKEKEKPAPTPTPTPDKAE